jgi:CubicO group peptidase (beta-lactamase class C family)
MLNRNKLPRSKPEDQGASSQGILDFIEAIETNQWELHSLMILKHGHVIAEGWWSPYRPEYSHMLFSLSKSFTSTAIGLAVSEGRLSVEDKVVSFFPEFAAAETDARLHALRVRDLLTMSDGHKIGTNGRIWRQNKESWAEAYLRLPLDYEPGSAYVYNSGASYMLSAILHKVANQSTLDYLQLRLFQPLGIEGAKWEACPSGIHVGGWGLSLKTEDIAKFGQLYLQEGVWKEQRLLPREWIKAATSKHIDNDEQGYGYQFKLCKFNGYRGDGAFGQFCIVLPDLDAVIAITGGYEQMAGVLDKVGEHLLLALYSESTESIDMQGKDTLTKGKEAYAQGRDTLELYSKLASLAYKPLIPILFNSSMPVFSGERYELEENAEDWQFVSFEWQEDGISFTVWDDLGEHHIVCGLGEWVERETTLNRNISHTQLYEEPALRIAACCNWSSENTFIMVWRFVETTFCETMTCCFGESGRLILSSTLNVYHSGTEALPSIHGKIC